MIDRVVVIIFVFLTGIPVFSQDKRENADKNILRLPPSAFVGIPGHITRFLERRNCSIPQTYLYKSQHNVAKGQFSRVGQYDWAVLCSVNRISSILVFWNGSIRNVSEIATARDDAYLQTISSDGKIGFSRMISAVDKRYIEDKFQDYGGSKPPPAKHQGISDAFAEKASEIHYFYKRKWLALQGAD